MGYLTISKNVDAIKHGRHRWQFFFQEHCTQRNGACNSPTAAALSTDAAFEWKMWFSCFPVLPGRAETQVIWGGILEHLLIAYFIGNICAKKYQNLFMFVKVIAMHRWDVFWDRVYSDFGPIEGYSSERCKTGGTLVLITNTMSYMSQIYISQNRWPWMTLNGVPCIGP